MPLLILLTVLADQEDRPEVIKQIFTCSSQLNTQFIMRINVEMPTMVGILTFIVVLNTTL